MGAIALGVVALLALAAFWQTRRRRKLKTPVQPAESTVSPFDTAVQTTRESVLADPARAASVIHLWVQ
jgi:hypothetical protein